MSDNGSNAVANNIPNNGTSQYLHATNFGFVLPLGTTIDGIVARVQRFANFASTVVDHTVQLIVGGTRSGDNKADVVSTWSTSATNVDYGAPTDAWGLSLTVADVNSSNFGLAFRATNTHTKSSRTASVDVVWLDIYYTPPKGPPTFTRSARFFRRPF